MRMFVHLFVAVLALHACKAAAAGCWSETALRPGATYSFTNQPNYPSKSWPVLLLNNCTTTSIHINDVTFTGTGVFVIDVRALLEQARSVRSASDPPMDVSVLVTNCSFVQAQLLIIANVSGSADGGIQATQTADVGSVSISVEATRFVDSTVTIADVYLTGQAAVARVTNCDFVSRIGNYKNRAAETLQNPTRTFDIANYQGTCASVVGVVMLAQGATVTISNNAVTHGPGIGPYNSIVWHLHRLDVTDGSAVRMEHNSIAMTLADGYAASGAITFKILPHTWPTAPVLSGVLLRRGAAVVIERNAITVGPRSGASSVTGGGGVGGVKFDADVAVMAESYSTIAVRGNVINLVCDGDAIVIDFTMTPQKQLQSFSDGSRLEISGNVVRGDVSRSNSIASFLSVDLSYQVTVFHRDSALVVSDNSFRGAMTLVDQRASWVKIGMLAAMVNITGGSAIVLTGNAALNSGASAVPDSLASPTLYLYSSGATPLTLDGGSALIIAGNAHAATATTLLQAPGFEVTLRRGSVFALENNTALDSGLGGWSSTLNLGSYTSFSMTGNAEAGPLDFDVSGIINAHPASHAMIRGNLASRTGNPDRRCALIFSHPPQAFVVTEADAADAALSGGSATGAQIVIRDNVVACANSTTNDNTLLVWFNEALVRENGSPGPPRAAFTSYNNSVSVNRSSRFAPVAPFYARVNGPDNLEDCNSTSECDVFGGYAITDLQTLGLKQASLRICAPEACSSTRDCYAVLTESVTLSAEGNCACQCKPLESVVVDAEGTTLGTVLRQSRTVYQAADCSLRATAAPWADGVTPHVPAPTTPPTRQSESRSFDDDADRTATHSVVALPPPSTATPTNDTPTTDTATSTVPTTAIVSTTAAPGSLPPQGTPTAGATTTTTTPVETTTTNTTTPTAAASAPPLVPTAAATPAAPVTPPPPPTHQPPTRTGEMSITAPLPLPPPPTKPPPLPASAAALAVGVTASVASSTVAAVSLASADPGGMGDMQAVGLLALSSCFGGDDSSDIRAAADGASRTVLPFEMPGLPGSWGYLAAQVCIVLVVAAMHFGASKALSPVLVRFPSVSLAIWSVTVKGFAFLLARFVSQLSGEYVPHILVTAPFTFGVVGLLLALPRRGPAAHTNRRYAEYTYRAQARVPPWTLKLVSAGRWVPARLRNTHGTVFSAYRPGREWCAGLTVARSVLLGIIAGIDADGGCTGQLWVAAVGCVGYLVAVAVARPRRHPLANPVMCFPAAAVAGTYLAAALSMPSVVVLCITLTSVASAVQTVASVGLMFTEKRIASAERKGNVAAGKQSGEEEQGGAGDVGEVEVALLQMPARVMEHATRRPASDIAGFHASQSRLLPAANAASTAGPSAVAAANHSAPQDALLSSSASFISNPLSPVASPQQAPRNPLPPPIRR
jgi:hypothetical protein